MQFKEDEEVKKFRVITGGKEPPDDPNNPDWLSKLDKGTVFLVQDKLNPNDFNLGLIRLLNKTDKSATLAIKQGEAIIEAFVNPLRFCKKYSLYEVLGVLFDQDTHTEEPEDEPKEDLKDEPKVISLKDVNKE